MFNDPRIRMNVGVSCGSEVSVTAADYLDYALDQVSTRVLSMVIEQARDPEAFEAVLQRAAEEEVPVVALKLGVSEAGQRVARSHSGAHAGNDAAYSALFDRYGVLRVSDLDEMAATVIAMSGRRRVAASGGLTAVLDSGGERGLLVDVAQQVGLPLANISNATRDKVAKAGLEAGLKAENPLDCGDGAELGQEEAFKAGLEALLADRDAAVGMLVADVAAGVEAHARLVDVTAELAATSRKPVMLMTNYSKDHLDAVAPLIAADVPVLDGTRPALVAVQRMLQYRDFRARLAAEEMGVDEYSVPSDVLPERRLRWREQLRVHAREEVDADGAPLCLCESVSMRLFHDYNVPCVQSQVVNSVEEVAAAAVHMPYPLVLKTGKEGVSYKTDVDGVRLKLTSPKMVLDAYKDVSERLGPRCILATMASGRLELILESMNDPSFGPMVMVGAGGLLMDLVDESTMIKAPCTLDEARRALQSLPRVSRVMKEWHGQGAVDEEAVIGAIQSVSVLAADLADVVAELDINPLLVDATGVVAVDAHIVPSRAAATARVNTPRW